MSAQERKSLCLTEAQKPYIFISILFLDILMKNMMEV